MVVEVPPQGPHTQPFTFSPLEDNMSRQTLINSLVDEGYEAGLLSGLNTSELVVLTTNVWSEAARAAAQQKRHERLGAIKTI